MILALCLVGTLSNVYDVVMPNYHSSCTNGCLDWSKAAQSLPASANLTQAIIDQMFIGNGAAATLAATNCAMPGARAGTNEKDCGLNCHDQADQYSYIYDSYAGPWCFCKDPVGNLVNQTCNDLLPLSQPHPFPPLAHAWHHSHSPMPNTHAMSTLHIPPLTISQPRAHPSTHKRALFPPVFLTCARVCVCWQVVGVENVSQYCTPAVNIPEQINLQYAASSTVVVGFITYEPEDGTTAAPQANLQALTSERASASASASAAERAPAPPVVVTGVTHKYSPPGRNSTNPSANATEFALPYMMHYITFPVTPGVQYNYSVKSGAANALCKNIRDVQEVNVCQLEDTDGVHPVCSLDIALCHGFNLC